MFRDGDSYFLVHADFVTELKAENSVRLYPYQTHFIPNAPAGQPRPGPSEKVRQRAAGQRAVLCERAAG